MKGLRKSLTYVQAKTPGLMDRPGTPQQPQRAFGASASVGGALAGEALNSDAFAIDEALSASWQSPRSYPDAHSDVGGGYEPPNQDIDNNYARIPMRDMMREAQFKSVRLIGYEQLKQDEEYEAILEKLFE